MSYEGQPNPGPQDVVIAEKIGQTSLAGYNIIRTEGALRLPTTYDNHPIPSHPIPKASLII